MLVKKFLAAIALAASALVSWSVASAAPVTDSADIPAPNAVVASNCPNIDTQWYAAGVVPAGYYKSIGASGHTAGYCYPISSCPAGTAWSGATESCQSICSGGTYWNGSACVAPCTGGQVWNGSSCACPSGQVWNGSSCGTAPTFNSFTMSSSAYVGSNFTVNWSTGNATSVSMSCSGVGAGSYNLAPPGGGSGGVYANYPGTATCTAFATNSYGTTSSGSRSGTAACAPGLIWNGSSCITLSQAYCPSRGGSWNGSQCRVDLIHFNWRAAYTLHAIDGWRIPGYWTADTVYAGGGAWADKYIPYDNGRYTFRHASNPNVAWFFQTNGGTVCFAAYSPNGGRLGVNADPGYSYCPLSGPDSAFNSYMSGQGCVAAPSSMTITWGYGPITSEGMDQGYYDGLLHTIPTNEYLWACPQGAASGITVMDYH